jgi:hypothetical protein
MTDQFADSPRTCGKDRPRVGAIRRHHDRTALTSELATPEGSPGITASKAWKLSGQRSALNPGPDISWTPCQCGPVREAQPRGSGHRVIECRTPGMRVGVLRAAARPVGRPLVRLQGLTRLAPGRTERTTAPAGRPSTPGEYAFCRAYPRRPGAAGSVAERGSGAPLRPGGRESRLRWRYGLYAERYPGDPALAELVEEFSGPGHRRRPLGGGSRRASVRPRGQAPARSRHR